MATGFTHGATYTRQSLPVGSVFQYADEPVPVTLRYVATPDQNDYILTPWGTAKPSHAKSSTSLATFFGLTGLHPTKLEPGKTYKRVDLPLGAVFHYVNESTELLYVPIPSDGDYPLIHTPWGNAVASTAPNMEEITVFLGVIYPPVLIPPVATVTFTVPIGETNSELAARIKYVTGRAPDWVGDAKKLEILAERLGLRRRQ